VRGKGKAVFIFALRLLAFFERKEGERRRGMAFKGGGCCCALYELMGYVYIWMG